MRTTTLTPRGPHTNVWSWRQLSYSRRLRVAIGYAPVTSATNTNPGCSDPVQQAATQSQGFSPQRCLYAACLRFGDSFVAILLPASAAPG